MRLIRVLAGVLAAGLAAVLLAAVQQAALAGGAPGSGGLVGSVSCGQSCVVSAGSNPAAGTGTQAMTSPVAQSVNPATASAGQEVTVTGTGFGATQGSGYVDFSNNGNDWGAPGSPPVQRTTSSPPDRTCS
jgi:hypothetical protein